MLMFKPTIRCGDLNRVQWEDMMERLSGIEIRGMEMDSGRGTKVSLKLVAVDCAATRVVGW